MNLLLTPEILTSKTKVDDIRILRIKRLSTKHLLEKNDYVVSPVRYNIIDKTTC
jgi:hypothetical protein